MYGGPQILLKCGGWHRAEKLGKATILTGHDQIIIIIFLIMIDDDDDDDDVVVGQKKRKARNPQLYMISNSLFRILNLQKSA